MASFTEPCIESLTLKVPIATAADDKFLVSYLILGNNKAEYFMLIICQQIILEKSKICKCHLLQIVGGALMVKVEAIES